MQSLLQDQPGLQVVGEASNGVEGVQRARELQPDLILLDLNLPDINGLEVAEQVQQVAPHSRILFVSMQKDPALVMTALSLGAKGYVLKLNAAGELLTAITAVLKNEQFVSPGLQIKPN